MNQRTIAKPVKIVGTGLHTGVPVKLELLPAEPDTGIVFYRTDAAVSIPLETGNVVDTRFATVLGKNGVIVSTIEHLLSAVSAFGIDNLLIRLDNEEVPIMDGSSAGYCMLLEEAGVREQEKGKKVMVVEKPVEVRDGDKFVRIVPGPRNEVVFEIRFDHPMIRNQKYHFVHSRENYLKEISRARTFGFLHEVQYLRSIGKAKGGSLENAIVLDDKRILNSEGLRYEDEFVRHKILDAIGDMAFLGMAFMGKYEAMAGSHHLNHLLARKLLEDETAYSVVEIKTHARDKELEKAYA